MKINGKKLKKENSRDKEYLRLEKNMLKILKKENKNCYKLKELNFLKNCLENLLINNNQNYI